MSLVELLWRVNPLSSRGSGTSADAIPPSAETACSGHDAELEIPPYDEPPPIHDDFDSPPSYTVSFSDAYKQWLASSEAADALAEAEGEYEDAKRELSEIKKELKALKAHSSRSFAELHKKKKRPSISQLIMKRKLSADRDAPSTPAPSIDRSLSIDSVLDANRLSDASRNQDAREVLQATFEEAHAAEMRQAAKLSEVESRFEVIKTRKDTIAALASIEDETWQQLKFSAESQPSSPALALQIGSALEDLTAKETAFGLFQKEKANLTRARLTVQHAHRYLTLSLKICDELHERRPAPTPETPASASENPQVRSGMGKLDLSVKLRKPGDGVFGRFGASMKVFDYQNAVRLSKMGQTCLLECIRVLEPFTESIPEGQLRHDFATLKQDGILQMAKIYNLVFGGRMIDSGVQQMIDRTLVQQEAAFACLTRIAVWVQNRVPECEQAEGEGRRRREDARRVLAKVWANGSADQNP